MCRFTYICTHKDDVCTNNHEYTCWLPDISGSIVVGITLVVCINDELGIKLGNVTVLVEIAVDEPTKFIQETMN